MKITIELSTGKKIELTQAEFNELFNRYPVYQPYYYPQPYYPSWPIYTTSSGTSTDGLFKLYHTNEAGEDPILTQ